LKFLLDASLGSGKVLRALQAAGAYILLVDDLYPPATADEVWLTEAGKQGWIVLSKDKYIRRRIHERQALLDHDVAAFILTSGSLTGDEMAEIMVKALPKIKAFVANYPRPFIAKVVRSGEVSLFAP
jgi:predicted nuclease of predicted toxin-antitoxin system